MTASISDFKSYVVVQGTQAELSDLKAYAVVRGTQAGLSDLKAYVVLLAATTPVTPFPAPSPIQNWLSRQPPRKRGVGPKWRRAPISAGAHGVIYSKAISDSAASTESYTPTLYIAKALSDTAVSSDSYGQPRVLLDQVFREALVSSTPPLAFAGLQRRVLVSSGANVLPLYLSQVTRRTLALVLPPTGYGPVSTYPVSLGPGVPTPPPIFPNPPIGFPVKVSPVMDTVIGTTKSLREMRVAQQTYPIWDIEILYEQLKDQTENETPYGPFAGFTQYVQVLENWLMMYGQAGVFAFDCFWDDSRENQYIATGDGLTYTFTIVRTWGIGAQATLAPVGQVNQVFAVYVDGVLQNPYTYNVTRNQLIFTSAEGNAYPPAEGAEVTMTFSYYYLCRFVEDEQDFEEFGKNRWTVPSLKFRASPW